jgi:hypothetical protein
LQAPPPQVVVPVPVPPPPRTQTVFTIDDVRRLLDGIVAKTAQPVMPWRMFLVLVRNRDTLSKEYPDLKRLVRLSMVACRANRCRCLV